MTSVMVTGAAGFIGSHFARRWVRAHPDDRVLGFDAFTYAGLEANLQPVRDQIDLVRGDITDAPAVAAALERYAVDVVVNFAAESHNSLGVLDPGRFFRTNVMGTQVLLEACRRRGVARFHHISTCEVYGDLPLDGGSPFTEESPYRPRTPYNASKAGADHAVRSYFETFRLPVTISNCANNYGPNQFPEKVIPLFTTNALRGKPLPVYSASGNKREWVHVNDHCAAIEAVVERGRVGETYHVGTGVEKTIDEIAGLVLDELDLPESMKSRVPDRPGHDKRYLLNWSKIEKELGWRPGTDFEDGVRRTIRWYADNPSWWEPLLGRSHVSEESWGSDGGVSVPRA